MSQQSAELVLLFLRRRSCLDRGDKRKWLLRLRLQSRLNVFLDAGNHTDLWSTECVCVRYLYKTCFKKRRSEIHLKMGCILIEYAKTRRSPLLIKQLLTCRAVLQKLNVVECDVTYYWFMGWNQRPFLKQKRRQASTCLTLECDLFSVVTYFWMHKTYFDR